MAYFSFTKAILSGARMVEYRNADGTELQRDFTYVSDIVNGVVASMLLGADLEARPPAEIRPRSTAGRRDPPREVAGWSAHAARGRCSTWATRTPRRCPS